MADPNAVPDAVPLFTEPTGPGTLTQSGRNFFLNLGTFTAGGPTQQFSIAVLNAGPSGAATLSGTLTLTVNSFSSPFGSLSNVAAGASSEPISLTFDKMDPGNFTETIELTPTESNGGTLESEFLTITATVEPACFLPGTLIRTPAGEVPIEALRIGDEVSLASGGSAPLRWLARQTVATRIADPLRTQPVRVRAGALGDGVPTRDLLLSPDHALFLHGVLVQAGALVNGTSIVRETAMPERFTYYNLELATHALIWAEGAVAETFVDNIGRGVFDNAAEHALLYPDAPWIAEMDVPRAKAARQVPAGLRRRLAAAEAA